MINSAIAICKQHGVETFRAPYLNHPQLVPRLQTVVHLVPRCVWCHNETVPDVGILGLIKSICLFVDSNAAAQAGDPRVREQLSAAVRRSSG